MPSWGGVPALAPEPGRELVGCALRGQGSPTEYPLSSHPNSDLRLILSTGQGESAKPLRCKTSLSLSVWLPPHPLPTHHPPPTFFHLCDPCHPGVYRDPVCWSLLPLSVWLAREGWRGKGGRWGGGCCRGNQGPGWAPE